MSEFISTILNMSLTGSIVILVVLAARLLMRKLPKKYLYLLWAVVGFRLLCPVTLESSLSIFNIKPLKESVNTVKELPMANFADRTLPAGKAVESRNALEFYCKLYAVGANYEKNDLVTAVSDGEAAFALGWPAWFISGTESSAQIAQIPGKKNSKAEALPTGEIGNWLLGVTSNSANKELSLEAIKYLTSRDVQLKALEYGGVPTRSSIFLDKQILEKYPHFQAIFSGTNNSRVRPRTTKWSRIEDVFGAELAKCISGEQSVDDTIKNSQIAIEALSNE